MRVGEEIGRQRRRLVAVRVGMRSDVWCVVVVWSWK